MKAKNEQIRQYILDCIELEGSAGEKLQSVLTAFDSEYNYRNNKIIYPNFRNRFSGYLQGLPSSMSVAYTYCDILDFARQIGSLKENATEEQEDKILSNWWIWITNEFFKLCKKENVEYFKYM